MARCKVYLILSALIACRVNANYERSLSQLVDRARPQVPWDSRYDIYEGASSKILPRYYDPYESSRGGLVDHFGSYSLPIPSFKKEPRRENEGKSLKKPVIPHYANVDLIKRKEFPPPTAHCRKVKVKSIGEGVTTCYKCKDPKTKSAYEHCLYDGPQRGASASKNVEHFLSAPVSFRYRRSNFGKEIAEGGYDDYHGRPRNPYRFTEDYFIGATHDVPSAYENKGEVCDKVIKDSMVCMVCKEPKTNGKYEQCSYVKQPREKAYSYTKSSSFGKPEEQGDDSADQPEETSYPGKSLDYETADRRGKDRNPTVVEESRSGYRYPDKDFSDRASTKEATKEQQDEQEREQATATDCTKIQKDSRTCVVCRDSKTGGSYEKCTYNYEPNEKLYKYSKSKSLGYPEKAADSKLASHETAETSGKSKNYPQSPYTEHDYFDTTGRSEVPYPRRSDRLGEASDDSDRSSYPGRSPTEHPRDASSNIEPESDGESYEGTILAKSASEGNSEDNVKAEHCKEFRKDSMTCTVCKDPKTGNDFERCSYSYEPSDKLFSYSKSRSFGNSQRDKSPEASHRDEEADSSETARSGTTPHGYGPGQIYGASTTREATASADDTEEQRSKKEVDSGYLNTAKKKAEIEEFVENFGKGDRSKCRKIMRDRMTCYRCVDEDGFQKEECVFVTGQEPDKAKRAFDEVKQQFQVDPAASGVRRVVPTSRPADLLTTEPNASASGNSYVKLEKPDNEYPEEAPAPPHAAEETKEAEPYDYTSETRPRYDKVLGLTLPAYMFTTSEHEAAFDEVVASSHEQR